MARKTKEMLIAFFNTEDGLNKLQTIKFGLETGNIKHFPQIFATIAKTNIHLILGGEFYAFDKKINDPGKFTYNETEQLAEFFQVDYDVMHKFIRSNQIVNRIQNKNRGNGS